jgi:hypothetical protein
MTSGRGKDIHISSARSCQAKKLVRSQSNAVSEPFALL